MEHKKKIQHDAASEFLENFSTLTYKNNPWEVWKDFIVMSACAISNAVDGSHFDKREEKYLNTIKKYNEKEQKLFPELFACTVMAMEHNPEQDFLGWMYNTLKITDQGKRQVFTPYDVCVAMARLMLNDVACQVQKDGYITLNDPCCGAGATLIAGVHEVRKQLIKVGLNFQNHLLVTAQDIDLTVALMCYIQLSLLGVAAHIKVGDTIMEPMASGDTMENYWFTPMYFSSVWSMRRAFHRADSIVRNISTKEEPK